MSARLNGVMNQEHTGHVGNTVAELLRTMAALVVALLLILVVLPELVRAAG